MASARLMADLDLNSPGKRPRDSNATVVSLSDCHRNLTGARQICGNFSAKPWQPDLSVKRRAVTPSPRKNLLFPHEKNAPQFCLRFVATKSHDVNVRRGLLLTTRLKRLTQLRISHHIARHARRVALSHAAQVLQAMTNFAACESARHAMRFKRLKQRAFSPPSARRSAQTAFGLPQRA